MDSSVPDEIQEVRRRSDAENCVTFPSLEIKTAPVPHQLFCWTQWLSIIVINTVELKGTAVCVSTTSLCSEFA